VDYSDCKFVRRLYEAENRYLEVLLEALVLKRSGLGIELEVQFDRQSYVVWNESGKTEVRLKMGERQGKTRELQRRLDAFLLQGEGEKLVIEQPNSPFRYASGGTLPVIWMEGKQYYCLYFRDIFPTGWNIVNGGCDSWVELCRLSDTIERELREELLIIDPANGKRFVFKDDLGRSLDRPEFAEARRFWHKQRPDRHIEDFEEHLVTPRWLTGPDSVRIADVEGESVEAISDCFLNIRAEDFGIEVDRIANIRVVSDVVFLDGEVMGGSLGAHGSKRRRLVDAPIGLFETSKFDSLLQSGAVEFLPDRLYRSAQEVDAKMTKQIVEKFLEDIRDWRNEKQIREFMECKRRGVLYDLCPIARGIISRYLRLSETERDKGPTPIEGRLPRREGFDVFISYGGEDVRLARRVYNYIQKNTGLSSFFSEEEMTDTDFGKVINDALSSAKCLVAVATNPEHLKKPHPEHEWNSFHLEMLHGKEKRQIVSFIYGCDPMDLPWVLRHKEVVVCRSERDRGALKRLEKRIRLAFPTC